MTENTAPVPTAHEALQNLVSLLEVTAEPDKATLWMITSSRMNQRCLLYTALTMYDTSLLNQLSDALEAGRAALGETKTETP